MAFTFSLDEMEKSVNNAILATRRPPNYLLPLSPAKTGFYHVKIARIIGGNSSQKGTPEVAFVFEVVSPEWVKPNGIHTTEDDDEAYWTAGFEHTERAYFTERAMFKFNNLFAGCLERLNEMGYVVTDEKGKPRVELPVDDIDWANRDPDVGKVWAEVLQPLVGYECGIQIKHKVEDERSRLVEDKVTGLKYEEKYTPINNTVVATVPLDKMPTVPSV
jgi:hypothetical protein